MKPGKSLKRLTPLKSKTQLARTTPMQRASRLTRQAITPRRPKVSPEERHARKVVAERAGGRAECCGEYGPTDWSHRVARSRGGKWCPSNGIALCRFHHSWAHSYPAQAQRMGWILRTNQDPATAPAWLFRHGLVLLTADGSITRYKEEAA